MSEASEEIICRTTPWYRKRRLLTVAFLIGFSLYFFYDWKIGYPAKQRAYDAYWPVYQELSVQNKDPQAWLAKAAENGWPTSPKESDWEYKKREQLIWGTGTGLIGLFLLGAYLRNRHRVLRADSTSLTTPDGVRIPFDKVEKIDKRKWDNKALAYLWWKDGTATRKAVIDDLVYDGAGKVLDRLMSHFHGELIDLDRDTPASPPASGPAVPPATHPA